MSRLLLVLLAVVGFIPSTLLAREVVLPERGICAHRGASATHPENTLAAIREAVRLGAHQIEIDVCLTRDGQLVLMHDSSPARTTNVASIFPGREKQAVSRFTLAELKQLDAGGWKHLRFSGEQIPTLEEALAVIPDDRWINLDIKSGSEKLGGAVAREILRLGRAHQAIFSVRGAAVAEVRDVMQESGTRLILNNMNRAALPKYVRDTIRAKYDFIQLIGVADPDPDLLEQLKAANVRINCCCSNSPQQIRVWLNTGIDFPLVDDVAAGMAVCKELGIPAPAGQGQGSRPSSGN